MRTFISRINLIHNFSVTVLMVSSLASLIVLNCRHSQFSHGGNYPELLYPEGYGTFVLFSTDDDQFFLSNQNSVGEAGNREELTNRIRLYLNILEEDYHNIHVWEVDVAKDRPATTRFQIYDIPTLVLVNKYGSEVRRWMPMDFEISGGSVIKLQKEIDKLIKDEEKK